MDSGRKSLFARVHVSSLLTDTTCSGSMHGGGERVIHRFLRRRAQGEDTASIIHNHIVSFAMNDPLDDLARDERERVKLIHTRGILFYVLWWGKKEKIVAQATLFLILVNPVIYSWILFIFLSSSLCVLLPFLFANWTRFSVSVCASHCATHCARRFLACKVK